MLSSLTLAHWLTLHGFVTLIAVLTYIVSAHVMHQRRQPTAAVAWMLFILSLPYVALPAFLMFGSRKLARPRRHDPPAHAGLRRARDDWAVDTIVALGQPEPQTYSDLQLHADGSEARAALLRTIDGARTSLDVCTFILGRDALGREVVEHLSRRAAAGVRVRLLLDGMGSLMARPPDLAPLLRAGGAFVLFVPPLRSPLKGRTNLRDHRKLVVADAGLPAERLWCGGRNLAAAYFEGTPGGPAWRDLSFDLGGTLVRQAAALFEQDWAFAKGAAPTHRATDPADPQDRPPPAGEGAQLVASGPDQADDTLLALLVTAAYRARRRVLLVTPYFVPDPALLMALCLAARRGVAVDLLLPARSNHLLSDLARGRALRSLAQAGGRVWLAPGMLHAKLAVFDDTFTLAGSANLDSRSLLLNYELMVAFHQAADTRRFADWFEAERRFARPYVAVRPGLVQDIAEGMLLWLGFQL
jgi:cardiolipin synthase